MKKKAKRKLQKVEESDEESEQESSEESEQEGEAAASSTPAPYAAVSRRTTHIKKKVLVVCSRGVTSANIELMEDLLKLLPHAKKDPKFDKKEPLTSLVEIAELSGCKVALYLEARKMRDLYLWVGSVEHGPSVKFLVQQVRPMRDLRLTGNCLLGSRPVLSFDGGFEAAPQFQLLKRLLSELFAPPKGHPRSKPFHDHVISFSLLDGRIIMRHYQVVHPQQKHEGETSLVEIGPRFALTPIRLLGGCFSGESLFKNDECARAAAAAARRSSRCSLCVATCCLRTCLSALLPLWRWASLL